MRSEWWAFAFVAREGAVEFMRSKKRLALLAAALLAIAIATATATMQASGAPTSAPACSAAQLRGKLLDSNGAAGTILFSVTLSNRGAACSLKGYPALGIANASGLLPVRVVRGGLSLLNDAPKLVKLAHLGKASVLIAYGDVPVGSETSCPSASTVLVRPPGAWDWLTVKAPTQACAHGTLRISPVLGGVQHAS